MLLFSDTSIKLALRCDNTLRTAPGFGKHDGESRKLSAHHHDTPVYKKVIASQDMIDKVDAIKISHQVKTKINNS